MRFAARVRSWVRSVWRHARLGRDMDEELRFHIDTYVDDLVRAGVPAADARRRARIEFGSLEARKEECREALGLRLVDEVTGDLRYAWRQLRRSPAFTAVAIASLVLGIGANAAILGLTAAMGLTRYIQSMLFGVEAIDPPTVGAAVFLMLIVALLPGWLPARRASRLEPMVALRHE